MRGPHGHIDIRRNPAPDHLQQAWQQLVQSSSRPCAWPPPPPSWLPHRSNLAPRPLLAVVPSPPRSARSEKNACWRRLHARCRRTCGSAWPAECNGCHGALTSPVAVWCGARYHLQLVFRARGPVAPTCRVQVRAGVLIEHLTRHCLRDFLSPVFEDRSRPHYATG